MAKTVPEYEDVLCAFDEKSRVCAALNVKNCRGCRFRKTRAELKRGRALAEARIKTLPVEYQQAIKEKYHAYARRSAREIEEKL